VEYQRNPYDLEDDVTVEDLYKRWSEHHFSTLKSDSSKRTIESAWSYCSEIYKIRVKDLRARHIKGVIDNGFKIDKKKGKLYPSASIKYRIKSMFNLMLDYAVEYEIVDKNYARTFEIPKDIIDEKEESRKEHIIFTEEEINILWENVDNTQFADWVLIQCYMGWRPQELGLIELKNISIENLTITGGMKSTSGKMRIVPIHHRIIPLIKKNIKIAESLGSEYLLNDKNKTKAKSNNYFINYDKYSDRFAKVIKELDLNPNHKAHDPRMTFVTRMKKAGADDGAIKKLVGHKNQDLTESVYTARDIEWLREDIEKMG
jgi:integrase